MKKVMLVFGTRPEAIKMGPLVHRLQAEPESFDVTVCVTAQHRQMLDQALKIFNIEPHIDLDIMKPGQDLFDVTAAVLLGMRNVFVKEKPDIVLVHGDTTSTLAASVAGFYAGVPVGHVEAGLRTYDMYAPFPEEFNRKVASRVARWHFAPTELSRKNLLNEGVGDDAIVVTGNTVIDALRWVLARIEAESGRSQRIASELDKSLPFAWRQDRFVLITGHRRENFGEGMLQICEALRALSAQFPSVHFVYPVHLNPKVQQPVRSLLCNLANVHLIDPLDYEPFIYLLKHCYLVLTDSGGIQEEAPSLGKPVLVMREVTERPEAVLAGTVQLVGASGICILESVSHLLRDENRYRMMACAHNPYGDGMACERIVNVLRRA
jgi:UDP-N-acetylglucosamine 2-epimerase (non-hydrolysing)